MDTTKTAGHNPNRAVETPEKPAGKHRSAQAEPTSFGNNVSEFFQFLSETWQEFRKISWPNREQVIKETWTVLVLVMLITGAVLAFDWAIAKSIFEPLDQFAKHMGGGIAGTNPQDLGPLSPVPGAPVDNPSMPGNALPPTGAPTTPVNPAPAAPVNTNPSAPVNSTPAAPLNSTPVNTPKP